MAELCARASAALEVQWGVFDFRVFVFGGFHDIFIKLYIFVIYVLIDLFLFGGLYDIFDIAFLFSF